MDVNARNARASTPIQFSNKLTRHAVRDEREFSRDGSITPPLLLRQ